jgi:hypothetical protein
LVNITNGINTFTVTKGAFEGIYKAQGYKLVHDYASETVSSESKNDTEDVTAAASVDTDIPVEAPIHEEVPLIEKPISQWSKAEVKQFAAENDISLEGTKNVNEAKEIIKAYIDGMK